MFCVGPGVARLPPPLSDPPPPPRDPHDPGNALLVEEACPLSGVPQSKGCGSEEGVQRGEGKGALGIPMPLVILWNKQMSRTPFAPWKTRRRKREPLARLLWLRWGTLEPSAGGCADRGACLWGRDVLLRLVPPRPRTTAGAGGCGGQGVISKHMLEDCATTTTTTTRTALRLPLPTPLHTPD